MTYISDALRRQVVQRANRCCEYCLLHQQNAFFPHEIDHIIAEKHRGKTELNSLCLSCFDCNRHKGSDIASIDPDTEEITRLFHPRKDNWHDHFRLDYSDIEHLTPVGRVTILQFQINSIEQVEKRAELIELGAYPCKKL